MHAQSNIYIQTIAHTHMPYLYRYNCHDRMCLMVLLVVCLQRHRWQTDDGVNGQMSIVAMIMW